MSSGSEYEAQQHPAIIIRISQRWTKPLSSILPPFISYTIDHDPNAIYQESAEPASLPPTFKLSSRNDLITQSEKNKRNIFYLVIIWERKHITKSGSLTWWGWHVWSLLLVAAVMMRIPAVAVWLSLLCLLERKCRGLSWCLNIELCHFNFATFAK